MSRAKYLIKVQAYTFYMIKSMKNLVGFEIKCKELSGSSIFDVFLHIFTVTVVVGAVYLFESPRFTVLSGPRFCVHAPS